MHSYLTPLSYRRRRATATGLVDLGLQQNGGARPPDGLSYSGAKPIRPEAGFHLRAFTLLELLAVIAIIAILAALVLGVGRRANETGRVSRAKAELAILAAALADYQRIHGDYPQTDDEARLLQSLIGRRNPLNVVVDARSLIEIAKFSTEQSRDPFADTSAVLIDPWGLPYRYAYRTETPWNNASFVLYSIGPDGRDSSTLLPGGFADPALPENVDNLYANH